MADIVAWEVTPESGVTNDGRGNFTFSENTGTTDRVYTITYSKTDSAAGTGVTGSTTYTVKPCCAMPGSQEVSTTFCNGVDKYVHISYQKTCNGGVTWEEVYSEDKLVERNSPDCQEPGCNCNNITLGTQYYDGERYTEKAGVSSTTVMFTATCGIVSAVTTDTGWIESIDVNLDEGNEYIDVVYNDHCACGDDSDGFRTITGTVTVTLDGAECQNKKIEIVRGPVMETREYLEKTEYVGFEDVANDVANGKKFVLHSGKQLVNTGTYLLQYTANTEYKCNSWQTDTNYTTELLVQGNYNYSNNKLLVSRPIQYNGIPTTEQYVEYNDSRLSDNYRYDIRKRFKSYGAEITNYNRPSQIPTDEYDRPCICIAWEGKLPDRREGYMIPLSSEHNENGILELVYTNKVWPPRWDESYDTRNAIKENGWYITVTITCTVSQTEQSTVIKFDYEPV